MLVFIIFIGTDIFTPSKSTVTNLKRIFDSAILKSSKSCIKPAFIINFDLIFLEISESSSIDVMYMSPESSTIASISKGVSGKGLIIGISISVDKYLTTIERVSDLYFPNVA